jgi:hypothetical protein
MSEEMTRAGLLTTLEQERRLMLELLPQLSDAQWRGLSRADAWTVHDIVMHVADSTYGLSLMLLGEVPPTTPANPETGWMDVDAHNEQRRQKNAALPREKVMSRVTGAFDTARRAVEATTDLDSPGPLGPVHTKGQWLRRVIEHVESHRQELKGLVGK